MILPIYAYGQKVLKRKAKEIDANYEDLSVLLENMWETMYNAKGVGLAAPQIGKSIRIFLVDTVQMEDDEKDMTGIKKIFINPEILEESGVEKAYEEGCLSIPDIRGDVKRLSEIKVVYYDENFQKFEEAYDGITARVIQHEYDHIEGKLFTEMLPPLRKQLVKRKLENIKKGKVRADYRMRFAKL